MIKSRQPKFPHYIDKTDQSIWISAPDFVTSLEDGDYVYFFFREQAVEYINCGKVWKIFIFLRGY
jgi:hypothetical protein